MTEPQAVKQTVGDGRAKLATIIRAVGAAALDPVGENICAVRFLTC